MKYLNALNLISGVGPQKIKKLLNHFQTPENIWHGDITALSTAVGEKLADKIKLEKNNINPDDEWEKMKKENIRMLTFDDPDYPILLKEIPNPPYILYTKGDADFINFFPLISIVGSRKFTDYGSRATQAFARDLSLAGITVVSGMALGIDTFAHRGAIEGRGKTIAVLGNGLDDSNIYPKNNFSLSRDIIQNGCLLSDYPSGISAGPQTFPARNRIIAGLSLGTLVIEAGESSGALITAGLALEYNREVFSVPGSIFSSQSIGTNDLLKKGARLVSSVQDILEELDLSESRRPKVSVLKIPQSKEEEIIIKILSTDPIHIDNLAKLAKLQTATVSSVLSMMEIRGWTKNIGGQNYIIT
jgi:DNA processing protein